MKKLIALLLALIMVFALVACGEATPETSENPPATTDETPTGEEVTITIWTYPIGKFGDDATMVELIGKFEAAHPGIKVEHELIDYTNGDTQVTSAITGGGTPDIIMEGPERLVTNWGKNGRDGGSVRSVDGGDHGGHRRHQRGGGERLPSTTAYTTSTPCA